MAAVFGVILSAGVQMMPRRPQRPQERLSPCDSFVALVDITQARQVDDGLMDGIALVEYDPRWPGQFAAEAARIRVALGEDLLLAVEHFGSTAVPGLSAKPVIDMLVAVRSLQEAREKAVPILEALGYAFWYDNPNADHLFFVKGLPPNGPRTHHVHMYEAGAVFRDRLLFRDYLRAHSDEARRYEAVKRDLAARFPEDREAYTDGKTEYVNSVMQKARNRE